MFDAVSREAASLPRLNLSNQHDRGAYIYVAPAKLSTEERAALLGVAGQFPGSIRHALETLIDRFGNHPTTIDEIERAAGFAHNAAQLFWYKSNLNAKLNDLLLRLARDRNKRFQIWRIAPR